MKRKVCVVVTARPSYSRIKTALVSIKSHPELELQLVVTASALLSRYGNTVNFIEQDKFKISAKVFNVLEGENLTTMAKSAGLGLLELATVFHNLKPDVVLTIADRYETISTAIAAAYMNIPVAHLQGGEITGSIDEKVRHAVTKLSDLHFVSSQSAAFRVIRMGEEPSKVFVTGCPSIDLAREVAKNPALDFDPIEKYGGVGSEINTTQGYLVVMQHPVTTEYKMARRQINETLHAVQEFNLPTFWFWSNIDAGADGTSGGIRAFRERKKPTNIRFFKNMESVDFLRLLCNSLCLIGNSSVGIRECSFLGVPVVNIGTRQIGRDRSNNVIDVNYDRQQIKRAIVQHFANGKYTSSTLYGDGKAGDRIAQILARSSLTIEKRLTY